MRILRVFSPLAIHNAGALRLVSLLKRAEQVSGEWRQSDHNPARLIQLCETHDGGDFTSVEIFGSNNKASSHSSPNIVSSSSTARIKFKTKKPSSDPYQRPFDAILNFMHPSLPEKAILKEAILVTTLSHPFLATASPLSLSAPSQTSSPRPSRPSSLYSDPKHNSDSERRRSTLSVPSKSVETHPSRRRSILWTVSATSRNNDLTSQSAPSTLTTSRRHSFLPSIHTPKPMPSKAHIVHVIPDMYSSPTPHVRKSKLVQKIEQFLLSFAYNSHTGSLPASPPLTRPSSTGSASSCSSSSSRSSMYSAYELALSASGPEQNAEMEKPAPYILPRKLLGQSPRPATQSADYEIASIIELVLLGALDPQMLAAGDNGSKRRSTLLDGLMVNGGMPRAWIGGIGDVKIITDGSPEDTDGSYSHAVTGEDDGEDEYDYDVPSSGSSTPGISFDATAHAAMLPDVVVTALADRGLANDKNLVHDTGGTVLTVSTNDAGLPTPPESFEESGLFGNREDSNAGRKRADSAPSARLTSLSSTTTPPLPGGSRRRPRSLTGANDSPPRKSKQRDKKVRTTILKKLRFWKLFFSARS